MSLLIGGIGISGGDGGGGGGGGTPGGSDTQIQFNDNGAFGGDPNLTWDKLVGLLSSGMLSALGPGIRAGHTTDFADPNANLTFAAGIYGQSGNLSGFEYVNDGPNTPFSITGTETDPFAYITVHLATDGGGIITTVANDILTEINANWSVRLIASLAPGSDGTGIVSETDALLSGGLSSLNATGGINAAGGLFRVEESGEFRAAQVKATSNVLVGDIINFIGNYAILYGGSGTSPARLEAASDEHADASLRLVALGTGTIQFENPCVGDASITATDFVLSDGDFLIKSTAAFTDGAAAQLGTLANAPASGNPTKWIPINDNGTTRYIPAW